MKNVALYTDLYQLSMAQGYFLAGKHEQDAAFDYYFRKLPFEGGFAIFAGLTELLEMLQDYRFLPEHLDYLKSQGFRKEFLDYLANFRLEGEFLAMTEGEVVFPMQPLVRVRGRLIEAQLLETALLNILNFETLIATKAARLREVAGDKTILEFGLRRAQGLGGMQASRAAFIGGANATSNVLAGFEYGIPINGTHAHAWIQSFDDERTAFRTYANFYPDKTSLLVDTYDTLKSGVPNAIIVAKELEAQGHKLKGIRLDSGDLTYLSQHARQMLDEAGLHYVKIVASNDLDENIIQSLQQQGAKIDVYGVGTNLVTAKDCPALGGVYKLIMIDGKPRVKISENVIKISLPGLKQVYRYANAKGQFMCDAVALENETGFDQIFHPFYVHEQTSLKGLKPEPLLKPALANGKIVGSLPTLQQSADYARQRMAQLPAEHKRLANPHVYRVGLSQNLLELRNRLIQDRRINTEPIIEG